jgi:hypothetical protein
MVIRSQARTVIRQLVIWILLALALIQIEPITYGPSQPMLIEANDELEWGEFWIDSYEEHADEFTALFNAYEVKRAKNGAMMIRQGDSGPYRFAKKG